MPTGPVLSGVRSNRKRVEKGHLKVLERCVARQGHHLKLCLDSNSTAVTQAPTHSTLIHCSRYKHALAQSSSFHLECRILAQYLCCTAQTHTWATVMAQNGVLMQSWLNAHLTHGVQCTQCCPTDIHAPCIVCSSSFASA